MFKRTCQRLTDLHAKRGRRIVRQPVVLSAPVSELGLKKQIVSRSDTRMICRGQPLPHSRFEIMLPLSSRVDATEARTQCIFDERSGTIFLPCGAINKTRRG